MEHSFKSQNEVLKVLILINLQCGFFHNRVQRLLKLLRNEHDLFKAYDFPLKSHALKLEVARSLLCLQSEGRT